MPRIVKTIQTWLVKNDFSEQQKSRKSAWESECIRILSHIQIGFIFRFFPIVLGSVTVLDDS